ncbi:hypothetical protein JMJ35_001524 [Cladonia borealis]|uniref:Uncharacterized protein n=1 Tax=Cladonia borealis TaxID=184061 RepID=A0AA39V9G6_9LECA|nr:hypothetical protein JMJ35_001524 [Cladonia borealis]
MELARALTSRRRHAADLSHLQPNRAVSMRKAGSIKRSAISSPLELISTTNVLAFDAPNIYGSSDESDSSLTFSQSSRATSPDTSSIESGPSPVEPNHLSSYFQSANSASRTSKGSNDCESPTIPQRAPSHTKKSHQASARLRRSASNSKSTMPPNTIHSPLPTLTSIDVFSSKPEPDHPFGAELTKVNELAEEIGARDVLILDDEEQYLMSHGLCKFGVDDYTAEISGLFGGSYNNPFSSFGAVWI